MKPGRISRELRGAELGDPRRSRRLVQVATQMAHAPQRSPGAACGGWSEAMAAYRLLASAHVTPQKILTPHRRALLERAAAHSCIGVIQDTSEIDFTAMKHMQGCGPLNEQSRRGFYLHSLYTVSESGLPLGLWDLTFITRQDKSLRSALSRKQRPLEQRESYRLEKLPGKLFRDSGNCLGTVSGTRVTGVPEKLPGKLFQGDCFTQWAARRKH